MCVVCSRHQLGHSRRLQHKPSAASGQDQALHRELGHAEPGGQGAWSGESSRVCRVTRSNNLCFGSTRVAIKTGQVCTFTTMFVVNVSLNNFSSRSSVICSLDSNALYMHMRIKQPCRLSFSDMNYCYR